MRKTVLIPALIIAMPVLAINVAEAASDGVSSMTMPPAPQGPYQPSNSFPSATSSQQGMPGVPGGFPPIGFDPMNSQPSQPQARQPQAFQPQQPQPYQAQPIQPQQTQPYNAQQYQSRQPQQYQARPVVPTPTYAPAGTAGQADAGGQGSADFSASVGGNFQGMGSGWGNNGNGMPYGAPFGMPYGGMPYGTPYVPQSQQDLPNFPDQPGSANQAAVQDPAAADATPYSGQAAFQPQWGQQQPQWGQPQGGQPVYQPAAPQANAGFRPRHQNQVWQRGRSPWGPNPWAGNRNQQGTAPGFVQPRQPWAGQMPGWGQGHANPGQWGQRNQWGQGQQAPQQ